MKLPRRRFLHLAAGAVAPSVASSIVKAQVHQTPPASDARERPLADRLAGYAYGLRYEDLDDATIERVKTHVIDTIGCGMGAWDEGQSASAAKLRFLSPALRPSLAPIGERQLT